MVSQRDLIDSVAALCAGMGGPPACKTVTDFAGVSHDVASECCDEATAHMCESRATKAYLAAATLGARPCFFAQVACEDEGGYLTDPAMATLRGTFDDAAALCEQTCVDGDPELRCATFSQYETLRRSVVMACGEYDAASPSTWAKQQQCDAECNHVLLSFLAACTTGVDILADPAMQVERRALERMAARCSKSNAPVVQYAARTSPSSCDSYEEYRVLSEEVRRSCCGADADCVDGVPTVCAAGSCQSAVLALNGTCGGGSGFLLDPAMAETRATYANASSGCCGSGGASANTRRALGDAGRKGVGGARTLNGESACATPSSCSHTPGAGCDMHGGTSWVCPTVCL